PARGQGADRALPVRPWVRVPRVDGRVRGDSSPDAAAAGRRRRPRGRPDPLRGRAVGRGRAAARHPAARRRGAVPGMTAALTGPVTGAALLAAAGCLAYALAGPRLARRLPPAVATRWLVVAALLVAVSSVLVVVAVAATWVGLLPGVGELGPWSAQRLRADSR